MRLFITDNSPGSSDDILPHHCEFSIDWSSKPLKDIERLYIETCLYLSFILLSWHIFAICIHVSVLFSDFTLGSSQLSDVKDALDNMKAINQHSAHMHLFGL
jgi:hypothetical protein